MIGRLGFATVLIGVLLALSWAFQRSASVPDDSSPTISLRPPVALAQNSNFPTDYAGIARYIKREPVDFSEIHQAATAVAGDVKETDGTSYLWIGMRAPDTDWPDYDLYADINGWVVIFLPRAGKGAYWTTTHMLARGDWDRDWPSVDADSYYLEPYSIGYRSRMALLAFVERVNPWCCESVIDSQFYHFAFPSATGLFVASEVAYDPSNNDPYAEFFFFVPETLTIEEVSTEFWRFDSTNFLSINGADIHRDAEESVFFRTHNLGTGRHSVELWHGGVTIAIVTR